MNRKRKSGLKKEKIVMLLASVFMLTALTMAGVYVNQRNTKDNDGYSIDLNELNNDVNEQIENIGNQMQEEMNNVPSDDMDVEISYEDVGANDIVLPAEDRESLEEENEFSEPADIVLESITEESIVSEVEETEETEAPAESQSVVTTQEVLALDFSENDTLVLPVVGDILLEYSMDQAIYFPTLQQYRYNPSLVIEAVVGEPVTAAADARIISITNSVETGGTVICDLGNGYELTYGQLENFTVAEGDYIRQGEILGFVAEPSIFYSLEGSNVYFKLTKDGEALNPMELGQ